MDNVAPRPVNRWRTFIWGTAAFLLLLPAIAMQFTREMNWTPGDFVVWGLMLTMACGTYELATRLSGNGFYRAGVAVAVLNGFVITWSNLAVGIIRNENNPVNLIFFGLLALGFGGAALARFRARGMVLVMAMLAGMQLLIALVAFAADWDDRGARVSLVFVALWAASAASFGKAGE